MSPQMYTPYISLCRQTRPVQRQTTFDNCVTLTFDLLTTFLALCSTASEWTICLPSLALIAQLVLLLERGQSHTQYTHTHTHRHTDSLTLLIALPRTAGARVNPDRYGSWRYSLRSRQVDMHCHQL